LGFFDRFRRRSKAPVNPSSPHDFQSNDDPGMGAAAVRSAGGRGGQALGMNVALTGNYARAQRCGVPGCGRDRDDPIHFPEG
jgi:hypothetical protein